MEVWRCKEMVTWSLHSQSHHRLRAVPTLIISPPSLPQSFFDAKIKALGVQNAYFPLFITEDVLNTEKDHVEGFAPGGWGIDHGNLAHVVLGWGWGRC